MSPSTKSSSSKAPTAKNAERERSRVRSLRNAFQSLQLCLPSVPPDTKLSKLDILILASNYIAQLTETLDDSSEVSRSSFPQLSMSLQNRPARYLKFYHPIKVSSKITVFSGIYPTRRLYKNLSMFDRNIFLFSEMANAISTILFDG